MKYLFLAAALVLVAADGDSMPPVSQFLKPPQAEIALARSAAPASISKNATVMVLTARGYTVAVTGTNGFTCMVDRAWMHLNTAPSWNAKVENPVCYNAAASRTILLFFLKRAALALSGRTETEIVKAMADAVAAKKLPAAAPDSIAYMMSKDQYIDPASKAWYPHLMFFMPAEDNANVGMSWGADRLRSPVVYDPKSVTLLHEPWARFFIPVTHWSDGSPAPLYSGT